MAAIGRTHARSASVRRDVLHKATTTLAQTYTTIVVEDLNVAGMTARKRGLGARGRGFNRAILDTGWPGASRDGTAR
ncbi:MAG TPA: transposase [Euzebya sp.]|nr:transposase [Euzebya sp.]